MWRMVTSTARVISITRCVTTQITAESEDEFEPGTITPTGSAFGPEKL